MQITSVAAVQVVHGAVFGHVVQWSAKLDVWHSLDRHWHALARTRLWTLPKQHTRQHIRLWTLPKQHTARDSTMVCRASVVYTVTATLIKDRSVSSWTGQEKASASFDVYALAGAADASQREMFDEGPIAAWLGCCMPCMPYLAQGRVGVRALLAHGALEPGGTCSACVSLQARFCRPPGPACVRCMRSAYMLCA
jgi:hypothetical protein